ncbi:MAG: ParB N-terminal domain-containing protein [Desulfurococcaceae archaeon]
MSSVQHAYEIKTPQITLKITVKEVDRLHIHEEIIPGILYWLVEKIKQDNAFKDPIIVDEKTLVVLDGMHRVAAVKELGFKYIPVCLVDYDNPSIGLYSWSRIIKIRSKEAYKDLGEARRVVLDVLSKLGHRLVSVPGLDAGSEMLAKRELVGLLVLGKSLMGVKSGTRSIKLIYDSIKRIEEALTHRGFEIGYYTEKDSLGLVEKGEAAATLIPPTITKSEVRAVALRGEVFIHKATRHVIPARPLGINIPLDWLTGSYSLSEVEKMLVEHLSRRRIKKLPPGTILDRRYEEELYVFE